MEDDALERGKSKTTIENISRKFESKNRIFKAKTFKDLIKKHVIAKAHGLGKRRKD